MKDREAKDEFSIRSKTEIHRDLPAAWIMKFLQSVEQVQFRNRTFAPASVVSSRTWTSFPTYRENYKGPGTHTHGHWYPKSQELRARQKRNDRLNILVDCVRLLMEGSTLLIFPGAFSTLDHRILLSRWRKICRFLGNLLKVLKSFPDRLWLIWHLNKDIPHVWRHTPISCHSRPIQYLIKVTTWTDKIT